MWPQLGRLAPHAVGLGSYCVPAESRTSNPEKWVRRWLPGFGPWPLARSGPEWVECLKHAGRSCPWGCTPGGRLEVGSSSALRLRPILGAYRDQYLFGFDHRFQLSGCQCSGARALQRMSAVGGDRLHDTTCRIVWSDRSERAFEDVQVPEVGHP